MQYDMDNLPIEESLLIKKKQEIMWLTEYEKR